MVLVQEETIAEPPEDGLPDITPADAVEATELPAALVATTVKEYTVPLVNPVTTIGELAPETAKPVGEEVTV